MKKIILTIFCVFALLFALIGNVFAYRSSCKCSPEPNGYEYCICGEPGQKYCIRCPVDSTVCVMVNNNCNDETTNNVTSTPVVNKAVPELANKAIAQVESRGEFYFLTKDGRKLTGKDVNQVPLEEGSKVVTGSTGHVRMTLPDNTTFTVGPYSDLVIDKFVYDPATDARTIMANLSKGVFRWVTGKVARKDPAQMKVTLPVGTIGIRGTDFESTVRPDSSGSVMLYFGQLEITEKKTRFKFLLEAGQKVTFDADGSFSRPMKVQ